MSVIKFTQPVIGPSFTPTPTGILISDLAHGTNGQIPVAHTSNATAYRTVSGDLSLSYLGVATITNDDWKTASVPLTSAQLKALNATPVELVAAPGSGKVLVVESVVFEMARTSTAYLNGSTISALYHGTSVNVHSGTIPTSVVTTAGAATTVTFLGPNAGSNGTALSVNTAIDIKASSTEFDTGTGTANVFIKYRIITLV